MAHWSENSTRLQLKTAEIERIAQLDEIVPDLSDVSVLWFPGGRTNGDAKLSITSFEKIAQYAGRLADAATLCVVTTQPDAASLLPFLERSLRFQLWVAVKTVPTSVEFPTGGLPTCHASLIILTRYKSSLRHTATRIKYTHCPACGKTTKDYGGKTHMYHGYGTHMSDVWTDIECDPQQDISLVISRLRDLFGLTPYKQVVLIDLRKCQELAHARVETTDSHDSSSKRPQVTPAKTVRSRLINKDCIEALKSLRSDSIDFCFADLPYNLKKKYYRCKDALGRDEYFEWCNEWLSELFRVLKPGRTLAVLNVPLWAAKHFAHLSSIMSFQSWIVWDALGFPTRKIMPAHYAILCFSKGAPRTPPGTSPEENALSEVEHLRHRGERYCIRRSCVSRRRALGEIDYSSIGNVWGDIHRLTHNSRRVNHPCQLPPLLMRRLLALFTKPGEVIVDCFNGAGTSTLVAQQMSRKFVGIEISTRYHKLALKRHQLIDDREDPFGKKDEIPIAKNSLVLRLPKRKYKVSKKALQLDVKRIASELGRIPRREDVMALSPFPLKYFDTYFSSWGEVCAAARVSRS